MFNGQKIKEIINLKGLSQKDVFTNAGIKEATFYSLFKENANPSSALLEAIANTLGCKIDDFFDRARDVSSIQIGPNVSVNGNGNKVGDITLSECQTEIQHLKAILYEKEQIIVEKERIIQLLINK